MDERPASEEERAHAGAGREPARDRRTGRAAAAERIRRQGEWVEQQLRVAQERGDFDDLPGFGKPLHLTEQHDPDWWIKGLVERERLSVLPPAMAIRKDDAELDDELDALPTEDAVRREVADFNDRVRHTLYSNPGGPPVVTSPRDADTEVARWQERRAARRAENRRAAARREAERPGDGEGDRRRRRRWWRR